MSTSIQFKGLTKVVGSSDLSQWTSQGYLILDSFDEDHTEQVYGSEPMICSDPHQTYHNGVVSTTRHLVLRQRKFLIGLSEESHVAELNERLSDMDIALTGAKSDAQTLRQQSEQFAITEKRLKNSIQVHEERERTALSDLAAEKVRIRKMEGDLGKLRQAVGDLKMREILGEPGA